MDITTSQLAQFQQWAKDGRRVIATIETPQGIVEIDGELKAAHQAGIMIRPRGRPNHEMAKMTAVEKLELFDDRPKPIEPKRMSHVAYGSIRAHLADRHGFALEELNEPGFNENRAYDVHDAEHHPTADKMSHFHEG